MFDKFNFVSKDTNSPKLFNQQKIMDPGPIRHKRYEVCLGLLNLLLFCALTVWSRWPRALRLYHLASGSPSRPGFDPRLCQLRFLKATLREFTCRWEGTTSNKRWTIRVKVDGMGEFFESCCFIRSTYFATVYCTLYCVCPVKT